MRKMQLEIADPRVETFAVDDMADARRGTVNALQVTNNCLTPDCPASVEPCVTHDLACLTRDC